MLILNLQEAFFREREIANTVQANKDIAVDINEEKAQIDEDTVMGSDEFESEIKALQSYCGKTLSKGLRIDIQLKELLEIIPQRRKRIDSYNKLVRYLKSAFGVELIISSQKTKNNYLYYERVFIRWQEI